MSRTWPLWRNSCRQGGYAHQQTNEEVKVGAFSISCSICIVDRGVTRIELWHTAAECSAHSVYASAGRYRHADCECDRAVGLVCDPIRSQLCTRYPGRPDYQPGSFSRTGRND